jgi:hypothetical protein
LPIWDKYFSILEFGWSRLRNVPSPCDFCEVSWRSSNGCFWLP